MSVGATERRFAVREVGPFAPPTEHVSAPAGEAPIEIGFRVEGAGDGTVLVGSPMYFFPQPGTGSEGPPVILFIGVDTLRADALGPWGRSPSLSPAIDALARESDVFLNAYSTFNITNPSFLSMMTGRYGRDHGVYDNSSAVAGDIPTLARELSARGYRTAAIAGARHLQQTGLARDFDTFDVPIFHRSAEDVVHRAMAVLQDVGPAPLFLWLHLYDPHTPHVPPEPFASGHAAAEAAGLDPPRFVPVREPGVVPHTDRHHLGGRELYDGEVAYLDRQLDRLLDFVDLAGLGGRTTLVFTADHGENLQEHGFEFAHFGLWESTTHVPLMIRWPDRGGKGRNVAGLVQTHDLFETLLRAADPSRAPSPTDLRDIADGHREPRGLVYSEAGGEAGIAVRSATHRLFRSRGHTPRGDWLYHSAASPEEVETVSDPEIEADLLSHLEGFEQIPSEAPVVTDDAEALTDEQRRQLEALGYLE